MQFSNDVSFYIKQNFLWNQLPTNIRSKFNNEITEYSKEILNYSLQNQLRFKSSLVSKIAKNERMYYEKLLLYSREHMLLYPYHLQDIVVSGLRMTCFSYYIEMLCQIMSMERSYDFIPNFTAADCLRLLGIGRNQYIDLMNTLRSSHSSANNSGTAVSMVNAGRRFLGLSPAANPRKDLMERIRAMLPQSPLESVVIEPWWQVSIGVVLEPDIEACSESTRAAIDRIIDQGPVPAASVNRDELRALYRRGMVYLDVPIEPEAVVSVPTLEGFVMNRTTGDYFETLLYKIFVAIDENSSVASLAQILEIPLHLVQQAVSVFCRLQFAHKRHSGSAPPAATATAVVVDPSWHGFTSPALRKVAAPDSAANQHSAHSALDPSKQLQQEMHTFLLDEPEDDSFNLHDDHQSSVDSRNFLKHSTTSLLLSPSPVDECSLAAAAAAASPSSVSSSSAGVTTGAMATATQKKVAFIFDSSLTAYLMMGNLSVGLKNHAVTMFEVGKLSEDSLDSLLLELDSVCDVGEGEARRYYEHAVNLRRTIRELRASSRHGLDLLRCGSLLSLDCGSRARMLARHYRCLISMAPINCVSTSDSVAAAAAGPGQVAAAVAAAGDLSSAGPGSRSDLAISTNPELPHFGPVIPEITSVWFKLFVYVATGSGPPSLLLASGSRLRTIPAPMGRYSRLLITPWQQESVVVSMNCALVTINDALTHSPLLVQGYDFENQRLDEKHLVFPIDIESIPDENLMSLVKKLDDIIDLSNKCGFINYLELPQPAKADEDGDGTVVHDNTISHYVLLQMYFGVPLFDRDINKAVLRQLAKMPIFAAAEPDQVVSDQYERSTRRLVIRLLEFIDLYGGGGGSVSPPVPAESGSGSWARPWQCHSWGSGGIGDMAPSADSAAGCLNASVSAREISWPTRNLFFHNGALSPYCCS